jgi:Flp pilus assembly pilin Flp
LPNIKGNLLRNRLLLRLQMLNQEKDKLMGYSLRNLWSDEEGQDIAEYSVMLAVILVIVVGTVRLIGSNAGNVFSQVGSAIQ